MAKQEPKAALEKMSGWLSELYGGRLQSLVLYGSHASENHRGARSDVNLVAVLDRIDAPTLDLAADAVRWWREQGNPPPVFLSRDEQDDAADVFPIEYLDIQSNRQVLRGADLFAGQPHDPQLHRRQVEHDLRTQLITLRGHYFSASRDRKRLEELLLASASPVLTLFRHALAAMGEPLLQPKAEIVAAIARRCDFSPETFAAIRTARISGSHLGDLTRVRALFADYLSAIQKVERCLEDYRAT